VAEPGLNWKWPIIDRVAGRVSLRVNQITLTMETKTKDNVFVTIPISVQNRVRPEKVYDAFYKLSDPMQQIQAYVEQVILGYGTAWACLAYAIDRQPNSPETSRNACSG
jgi:regulator of protease activity HflC (stomatin/prohibitin superfamily)